MIPADLPPQIVGDDSVRTFQATIAKPGKSDAFLAAATVEAPNVSARAAAAEIGDRRGPC